MDRAYVDQGYITERIDVSASNDNATVFFDGKAEVLGFIYLVGSSVGAIFVKLYDKNTLPTSSDTPILTARMFTTTSAQVGYPQTQQIRKYFPNIFCENGISIRITGGVADNDTSNPPMLVTPPRWLWIVYKKV